MTTNPAGIELIKSFEGCKLVVYKDIVGLLTVGYGHRCALEIGTEITQDQADAYLVEDLVKFETGVSDLVTQDISSNQFSAMVCFAYNLGLGSLRSSTLLRCFNKGNATDAAVEFLKWNKAGGVVVPGLTRRREAEQALFLTA